jgi:hypothetical protein
MRTNRALFLGIAAVVIATVWAGSAVNLGAQQSPGGAVQIDGDDIGDVVTGPSGPAR